MVRRAPAPASACTLAVNKRRNLFPGRAPTSRGPSALPLCSPCARRNLGRLPFRGGVAPVRAFRLPLRLASPASNCCSRGTLPHLSPQAALSITCYCHQDLHQGPFHAASQPRFATPPAPAYLPTPACVRSEASVARLSAIHFQGCSIRQVSCYTLLGGCRLPWPPSCCPDGPTPFVVSLSGHSGTLASRLVHPTSPVLLTKKGPLETCICRAAPSCSMRPTHSEFENRSRTSCPQCL